MLLSKLEIKGFKSFAEAVVINFDAGVTGIVGPNGCGKSNVVDAIRWVLGEQRTKALRSDKMENIIFNGTAQRKPATVAQVSLTFDNTKGLLPAEFPYVTITRRLYRSGESEYLINDVRCRLKDIHHLFLDTGIGADSYAIIELKKVDEILNDTDGSRRDLFEKAAGIAKYKMKKKEALARLAHVDDDLNRVGDLLFEIEKNLKSLEKQARQAERFFALKEEYKQASLVYAQKSIARQREEFVAIAKQIQTEQDTRLRLQQLLDNQERELEQEKIALSDAEKVLALQQNQLQTQRTRLQQLESEQKLRREKILFLENETAKIRQQIDHDLAQLAQSKQALTNANEQLSHAQAAVQIAEDALRTQQTALEQQRQRTTEQQAQYKSAEARHQAKQQELFQGNKQLEVKQAQLSAAKLELEKIALRDAQQRAEIAQFTHEIDHANAEIARLEAEIADYHHREQRRLTEIQELEAQVAQMRLALSNTERTLDRKQNEHSLIKSLMDNMEGFPEAVRYLQAETEWGKLNLPLLSDILVCEEDYRLAVENYLEPFLNYYVVPTASQAQQAIQLLSEAQRGKANFFILEWLPQAAAHPPQQGIGNAVDMMFGFNTQVLRRNPEASVPALDVVSFEAEHSVLIHYLLEGVEILPDDEAITHNQAQGLVSRSGAVLRRAYALSGGSVGAFEGKRLGRAKHLEQLALELQDLQNQIHEQQQNLQFTLANLQSLKQNNALRDARKATEQQREQAQRTQIAAQSKREQLQSVLSGNSEQQAEIHAQIADILADIERIAPNIYAAQQDLDALREQMLALNEVFAEAQEELALQTASYNQTNLALVQQRNTLTHLTQDIDHYTRTQAQTQQRLAQAQTQLTHIEGELEALLAARDEAESDIAARREDLPAHEQTTRTYEQVFFAQRAQIIEVEQAIKETQRQRENHAALLNQLQNRRYEIELGLTAVKERLSVEFQIDLDGLFAIEIPESDQPEADLQQLVQDLRQKIERLGTVNPLAMQEFNETQARYQFISTQKADLETSKKALMQTIDELEAFAREAFMTAFEEIRANFVRVFRSLFTEDDRADLVLAQPDNPLESDIDIIAQPKGKRPLTIDQLSGGEKTLTATSLLFALYLRKPAPFCIFDEVDAPLDDANTEKFNRIIQEFSRDSQFIIVTHNKRTMSSTDIMYGVTMLQAGVSSVVPVDLREFADRD